MKLENCDICHQPLTGQQRKYCSNRCKDKGSNGKHQSYQQQRRRGLERKTSLIKLMGGACSRCGYSKNSAAIQFHHVDPDDKSFAVDLRRAANGSFEKLLSESDKCVLLCNNCHTEEHHPEFSMSCAP